MQESKRWRINLMRPEQVEKAIPLTLILIFATLIGLRGAGVIPPIVATDTFETSRTIFVDAGIGGLLTVLAIVISLTIMSIQFASQVYTHRLMNTYMKSFMLWSMIGIYITTILYNLYMTAIMKTPINTTYSDVSVLLQSLCLIMLIPHFVIAVIHLKPDFTIGIILRSIDKEYISSLESFISKGKKRVPSKVDRLLPAVEIIEKSIERGDRETVRVALEELYDCYQNNVNSGNEDWASRYFVDHLLRIGREAIIEADDDSIVQVLSMFSYIGSSISAVNVSRVVIDDINTIGLGALKKDLDAGVEQMIDSLQQILKSNATDEISHKIFDSYGNLTERLFSLDKNRTIKYLVGCISGLSEMMVKNQDQAMVREWTAVLGEIGRRAIAQKMREVAHESIHAFYHIGTLSAKKGFDITSLVVEPLIRMEREIAPDDRELISEIEYAKKEIEESVQKYIKKGKEETGIETSDLW